MKKVLLLFCLFFCKDSLLAQYYWQQKVDYEIDVDMDLEKNQYNGKLRLVYTNHSPDTLDRVFFHLYYNAFQPGSAMDVRSRTIVDPDRRVGDRIANLKSDEIGYHKITLFKKDGINLEFEIEGTVLEAVLDQPILPGKEVIFEMSFKSQVPLQIRRTGRDNKEGIEYSMSQWYPKIAEYDRKGWHTHPYIGREFYSPWGDYKVNISIDKNYTLAATGTLRNADDVGKGYSKKKANTKGKRLTWRFEAENVHDFVWAADPDYRHDIVNIEGIDFHFFYQKDTLEERWNELKKALKKALPYINVRFGKYPYGSYSVIQGGDGGMEYPMATLITGHRSVSSLIGVTIHELMHSWFQMLLATNESYYAWMDEGFTSYASAMVEDYVFNDIQSNEEPDKIFNGYSTYYSLQKSGKEEPLSVHADHFNTNFAYGAGAYGKGAVALHQLEYIVGKDNLSRGMRDYYYSWRFKHPDLNDFIRVIEKRSGLELDWYFEYWVNTVSSIDYGIKEIYEEGENTTITLERKGKMPMPLDIQVTFQSGKISNYYIPLDIMRGEKPCETSECLSLTDWPWVNPYYSLSVEGSLSEIKSIEIDPSGRMADVNPDNGIYPFRNEFLLKGMTK